MENKKTIPDMELLQIYKQNKLLLADQLRIIREVLEALGREIATKQFMELTVKLAEDRFNLTVLGQFKRGKSSLMNAIIGKELLPTGVLPLTSAITVLKYGPSERCVISREGALFNDERAISALPEYVTEKGNPGNVKKVKTATVELPAPFLRQGIEFIDTPGVGSAIAANTETTYSFLPECDAAIFVTSVDTPMTSTEMEFLKTIRQYIHKIFFVVNKIDLAGAEEREEVLKFVADMIQSELGLNTGKIFPVSARLALEGRVSSSDKLYKRSGLKELEEALGVFLSSEKSLAFLAGICRRALRVLAEEEQQEVFSEHAINDRMEAIAKEKVRNVHRNLKGIASVVGEAKLKLEQMSAALEKGLMKEIEEIKPVNVPEVYTPPNVEPLVSDLKKDLQARGCAVCDYVAEQVFEFFIHWQYQLSIEDHAQTEFAKELGFCPVHTWQLLSLCSPQGASTGFAKLAAYAARYLSNTGGEPAKIKLLAHNIINCRICKLVHQSEEKCVGELAVLLKSEEGQNSYEQSQGVCLRHLSALTNAVQEDERKFILAHSIRRFSEDAEDMRSYSLKRDALRRHLNNENEEDAYRRAVIRLVGDRNVCLPWAEDRVL